MAGLVLDHTAGFAGNMTLLAEALVRSNGVLAPVLVGALEGLSLESGDLSILRDSLLEVLAAEPATPTAATATPSPMAQPAPPAIAPAGPRWFLDRLEVEGFRGINNEGSPLAIRFKSDAVNSVSAPNGVGKSSLYDALCFALTGGIPKIDRLLASERDRDYYLNLFHPGTSGTVKVVFRPDDGGKTVSVTVTRDASGNRVVSGPAGLDAEAFLRTLNREFVLLDAQTFQSFIDDKAIDRGRAFSGLLGLARYSTLRQQLQALANTRSFNNHFSVAAHEKIKVTADTARRIAIAAVAKDYEALVKEAFDPTVPILASQERCLQALAGIPILTPLCVGSFAALDLDAFMEAVREAEGGDKRKRLSTVLQEEAAWAKANASSPDTADVAALIALAKARDDSLKSTAGGLFNELLRASEKVLSSEGWAEKELCPTCGYRHDHSVLDIVHGRLDEYRAVETAAQAAANEWAAKGWSLLVDLEARTLLPEEASRLKLLTKDGESGTLSSDAVSSLAVWITVIRERAAEKIAALAQEKEALEKELPPSLVAVTTAVETARRLQKGWEELHSAQSQYAKERLREERVSSVKLFLTDAATTFADAESAMASERLKNVLPLCKEYFAAIMYSPVVPALKKPQGGEEVSIRLAEFWSEKDVSAQALLSESFRNAFAVSVYLAAASLYGGAPRFLVLDDVTSSFDAGHQHHLVEVIRTRFALPRTADGPQVIFLSHDTLLEKLFNKHSLTTEWAHQRLEGTARTAVLLQSGAVNKVRDATIDLLNAGRVDDAAPRIRQYLEYILHEVIDKVRIPVPMDLAFGDDKRTPGEYLNAIEAAVALHKAAGSLVLDATQQANLGMASSTIVSNFLSHWSTGQSSAFSAPALLGVMKAIEDFPDHFKHEPSPGAGKRFYKSLGKK